MFFYLPFKNISLFITILLAFFFISASHVAMGQDPWKDLEKRPSTIGLENGTLTFHTPALQLQLVKSSQTVAALIPNSDEKFDFTPNDRLKLRSSDGMYHLGDLDIRLRIEGETTWSKYSTAAKRAPVTALTINDNKVLAAADLSATLPAGIPINVQRYYEVIDGRLVLLFKLKNTSDKSVEIGSLGIPMIFNNILQGKSLEDNHAQSVFYDPYIGKDAGYLQVTRLNGQGPALLVVPYGKTPFEAYNPLLDDPTPRGIDFEGFYEWMVHTKAYAENEWKTAEPWNTPTSFILKPGETTEYGVQFLMADSIRSIESKLIENNRPVAIGIPGYVLPMGTKGKLFLNYREKVKSLQVEPANALVLNETTSTNKKLQAYQIEGKIWGRARLTITYEDGLCQTINYKVIKSETNVLKDYGRFLTHEQWYENKLDPFHRDQSVITYDYETRKQVAQDSRVWIAGLSDEGGAGSWLGAMMKELVQPDKSEIDKLQHFVNHTLWGVIQHDTGLQKYGVKKSAYYYEPKEMPAGAYSDSISYKGWTAWSHETANDVGRSYNYPHVASAWWVLYRLSRNHVGLVTEQNWQWYLDHAYQTTMAMVNQAPYYVQFGQMEGTVFYMILMDLKAEGWKDKAAIFEAAMKLRADHWASLMYPFGSEMPWDSTGQEEVYLWSRYFGYADKAYITINAILGYMPTIPNWGYNGSARRYWDFLYGGKLRRIERQLHHYGSGLNAIPVLTEFRNNPDDLYLLRVGYGGLMGSISNITEDGFGPAAFHSFPSTLKIDGLSGDYGPNFFGYAINTATYITHDNDLGWLAFGGNLVQKNNWINVKITNGAKSRVFVAPAAIWLTLNAGTFNTVSYNTQSGDVSILLDKTDKYTPQAFLNVQQVAHVKGSFTYRPSKSLLKTRGAYIIHLTDGPTKINLTRNKSKH